MIAVRMERANNKSRREKRRPRIPIKTYRWEDIRRDRQKGGYPWTYLYKQPFNETLDVESYTMEGLRKTKSSSTMEKSDTELVSEFSDIDTSIKSGEFPEKMDTLQIVTEPDNHSSKNSASSLNIEEISVGDKEDHSKEILESGESWDNISQYLDKEESGPTNHKLHEEAEDVQMPEMSSEIAPTNQKPNENTQDASKRKRKLSAESSYSKISQTKSAIIQKFNETKKKIKVPKLSFSTNKLKRPKSVPKKKNSPPEIKKEIKKPIVQPAKDVKPVYVHIPLKPPPGKTDEFSYLEFGEKKEPLKKPGSFRDLVKNIKQLQEQNQPGEEPDIKQTEAVEVELKKPKENLKVEKLKEDKKQKQKTDNKLKKDLEEKISDETPEDKAEGKTSDNPDVFKKCENYHHMSVEDVSTDKIDDHVKEETKIEQDKSTEEPVESKSAEQKEEDIFDHLFKASASKKVKEPTKVQTRKNARSKSAEPEERSRKLSMESSYSRKSLSKLSIMKKLKDASDYLKNTLTRRDSKKKTKSQGEQAKKPHGEEAKKPQGEETTKPQGEEVKKEELPKKEDKKTKDLKSDKNIKPVYIHIPLKPPEGEADEFSHLTNLEKPVETKPTQPVKQESTSTATPPESPPRKGKHDVQFIYLTAPSDDEVLDYNSSDVCDTPSSENKLFFSNKITELKKLAKDAVDGVTGSKTKLESVDEETNGEKEVDKKLDVPETASADSAVDATKDESVKIDTKSEEMSKEEKVKSEEPKKSEETVKEKGVSKKVMVDEEDGLEQEAPEEKPEIKQLPESQETAQTTSENTEEKSESQQSSELKSSLKQGSSPVMKKKVSFKRRSKTPKDGSYEDIQTPDLHLDINKAKEGIKSQVEPPISLVDQIIASTSKDDEDKWSKVSDHEYEPVNPPPENIDLPPQVYIIDTDYDSSILPLGAISFEQTTIPIPDKKIKEETDIKTEVKPETIAQVTPAVKQPENSSKTSTSTPTPQASEKGKEGPSKFQIALKQKTDNIKNKFQSIKKPSLTMPERPKFNKPDFKKFKIEKPKFNTEKLKFHIEKPKFNLPKIPDTAKITLPSLSLQRKRSGKRSLKERQFSTESTAGDSKKPIFNFGTYPFFKRKSKAKQDEKAEDFATIPRSKKSEISTPSTQTGSGKWSGSDSIRIPLHSEDSMEDNGGPKRTFLTQEHNDHTGYNEEMFDDDQEVAVTNQDSSHIRYEEDIDIDDDYERENNELNRDFLNRWEHGRFNEEYNDEYLENLKNSNYKVTDLDSPEENHDMGYDYNSNENRDRDRYSSSSSFGHRRGVMEEINADEFFWRPKGISQDDIHISMNISSEIRQAFQTPQNALRQIENLNEYSYEDQPGSRQSLQEVPPKRKPVKKPKRKKTPHTSQERIPKAEESADDDGELMPPSRPKRRSKRKKKEKIADDFVPYRETISLDRMPSEELLNEHRGSLGGILGDDEQDEEIVAMYENERMEGREQPEIQITDPYSNFGYADEENEIFTHRPAAPPRKQKSLKSLNLSEHDSILGNFSSTRAIASESTSARDLREPQLEAIRTESKVIIPIIDSEAPPKRPSRMRSRTGSRSRGTSLGDEESVSRETSQVDEENFSRTDLDFIESPIPCVEEPCIQDIRDPMGYAVVDKSKLKDPPLPPPRIPGRHKRSLKPKKDKFNTVPARKTHNEDLPVRPLRNYSTLVQAKNVLDIENYENKENIENIENIENTDVTPYIEIDDEPNRNLQSGEIIQKMKDRPLPAPPRPPRKGRALRDITSEENIMAKLSDELELDKEILEETEVSTQTEPLPDDFVCEELVQEPSDRIVIPSSSIQTDIDNEKSRDILPKKDEEPVVRVEKRLITPTQISYEETITHGSLLVEPLGGARILPDSELTRVSRERIVPITRESEDETSSVPEDFHKLSDGHRPLTPQSEIEVLKAQKLQVADLDVDRLTVNQLLANKIIVSEIESGSIQTHEIGSKSGTLTVGEINLPPSVIEQIVQSIRTSNESPETPGAVQKKTSMNEKSQEEEILVDTLIEEIIEVTEKPYIIKEPMQLSQKSSDLECSHKYSFQKLSSTEGLENQTTQKSSSLESLENQIISDVIEDFSPEPHILEHEIHLEQDEPLSPPIPPIRSTSSDQMQKMQTESIENPLHVHIEESENISEISGNHEAPPRPPPRSIDSENLDKPPSRPPRDKSRKGSVSTLGESVQEPDVDDEPPPRPPDPQMGYIPSQPPASFYALRAQKYVDENIPMAPRRRRRTRSRPRSRSRSTSEDSSPVRRHRRRSSEPSIAQLSCQLVHAAGNEIQDSLKRLINYFMNNVLGNADGKQDLNVIILIVLVLIAGLILLGGEDERTVVHMHHWEYFNPPRDM